nr:hypothetical protein [uncultured Sphingomonas sp.]
MPKHGRCSICGREGKLVWHHCHLQDAVKEAMSGILVAVHGRVATHMMFARVKTRWNDDARIVSLLRFSKVRSCELCNVIDILVDAERPGPFFSLSPDEIRAIRRAADHDRNEGDQFFAMLSDIRFWARSSYLRLEREAFDLGRTIALEWHENGVAAEARRRLGDASVLRLGAMELRVGEDRLVNVGGLQPMTVRSPSTLE